MSASRFAPARVRLAYWWRHGRRVDLAAPALFTEWVQHRKLHDRDARLPLLADKVGVKALVAATLGQEWVTPTLWHGIDLPERPVAPLPLVVKSRHGCGHVAVVRDPADWARARALATRWMRRGYGRWLDEWAYDAIPRGVLVEPFLGPGPALPIDYKLFVFGGRAAFVQVHLDRATDHRWIVMDLDWRRVSAATPDPDPPRPVSLDAMIAGAQALARARDFLRIDLYEIDGRPRFGEFTIYPGSGLLRVEPLALDREMGRRWGAGVRDDEGAGAAMSDFAKPRR